MADELKLGGQIDPKLLTGVREFQAAIRTLDLLFKQNKISADDLKKSAAELGNRVKDSNIDWTKQVTLLTSLHHVQERADVGFKSMSRTLKEMYAEERVQNRTLSEMKQTVQSLAGVIGGEAGKQAGTLVANFQGLEFAAQASGLALGRMSGSLGMLGTALATAATPLAILGAGFLSFQGYIAGVRAELAGYLNELDKLQGKSTTAAERELRAAKASAGGAIPALLAALPGTMGTDVYSRDVAKIALAERKLFDATVAAGKEQAANAPNTGLPDFVYEQGKKSLEAKKPAEHDYTMDYLSTRYGTKPGRLSGLGMGVQPGAAFKGGATVVGAPSPGVMFTEAEGRLMAFQSSFTAGVSAMSSTLSGTLGGAFARVFGGAHTLLGSFAQAFASTMASLAANAVVGLIFKALGFSIFGIGGGAASPSGAASIAESPGIGPADIGGRSSLSSSPMKVEFVIQDDTLVAAFDRGNTKIRNKRA